MPDEREPDAPSPEPAPEGPPVEVEEDPGAMPDPAAAERERCLAAVRRVLREGPVPHSLHDACDRIEAEIRGGGDGE